MGIRRRDGAEGWVWLESEGPAALTAWLPVITASSLFCTFHVPMPPCFSAGFMCMSLPREQMWGFQILEMLHLLSTCSPKTTTQLKFNKHQKEQRLSSGGTNPMPLFAAHRSVFLKGSEAVMTFSR